MEEAIESLGWIKDGVSYSIHSTNSKVPIYINYSIIVPHKRHSGEYFTLDQYELLNSDGFALSYIKDMEEVNRERYCKYNLIISNPYGDFIFKGIIETKEELRLLMIQLGIKSNYNI